MRAGGADESMGERTNVSDLPVNELRAADAGADAAAAPQTLLWHAMRTDVTMVVAHDCSSFVLARNQSSPVI